MIFFALIFIPLVISFLFYTLSKGRMTLREYLLQTVSQLFIAGISMWIISGLNTIDTETYNGRITNKKQVRVSCQHSYQCFCVSVSCGKGCRTRVCQTCYEHTNDWDWRVYTNINEEFNISRIDRRGSQEPPRFSSVKIGEPYSSIHRYTNYVKASPDSLFRKQGLVEKYKKHIPQYPQEIYDYHRLNRVVLVNGAIVNNIANWNNWLSELNADLGPAKHANVVLVITKSMPTEYANALEEAWLRAKDNDVVIVLNTEDNINISWSRIISWTNNTMLHVKLRDELLDKPLDTEVLSGIINKEITDGFKPRDMSEFEYLKSTIVPTGWQFITALLFGIIVSIVVGKLLINNNEYD